MRSINPSKARPTLSWVIEQDLESIFLDYAGEEAKSMLKSSLLLKELREHRWTLLIGSCILTAMGIFSLELSVVRPV